MKVSDRQTPGSAIQLDFSYEPGLLRVRARGIYGLPAILEAYEKAFSAALKKKLPIILIDVQGVIGHPPTTSDRFIIGEFIAEHSRGLKFALVGIEPMIDPQRFGEIVAVNRGANARAFTDLAEAEAWLKSDSPAKRR